MPDGRIITVSSDSTVKVWRDGACERTIQAHTGIVYAVAVLPGGARFVSVSEDGTAKLWTLDGALERTFEVLDNQHALSASTDHAVKLFNVNDGAVLRNFTHHTKTVECLALLPDGLRFVSGSNEGTARIVEIGRLC